MPEEKPRILIVDDDGEIRDVLKEFLSRDYDCVTSDSAEKALDALATQQFHLILSDIAMTAMSGIEIESRTIGISTIVVVSSRPLWPPASNPSATTASTPACSAFLANFTLDTT